jgi:hypothetical protein
MIALLLGGTVVLCAGVLAIVFGIPIKEFSVGNTLILSGSVVASAGVVLIGLGIVVRELKQLGRRFELSPGRPNSEVPDVLVATVPQPALPAEVAKPARPAPRAPGNSDFLFSRDQPQESPSLDELDMPLPPLQPAAPSQQWPEDTHAPDRSARERGPRDPMARPRPPLPPRPERAPPVTEDKPRRDFLFSTRRRNAADAPPPPPPADSPQPDFSESEPASMEPPLFDTAWPPAEPARPEPEFAAEPRGSRPRPAPRFPAPSRSDAAEVTVVKSGVVDTMAYSLYSDGSIEAQLPEGTVRFESIDELRAHLDQRGS